MSIDVSLIGIILGLVQQQLLGPSSSLSSSSSGRPCIGHPSDPQLMKNKSRIGGEVCAED
jgi:hypothetical protein